MDPTILETTTDDGVVLRMHHYVPEGPARASVVLQHGLTSNGAVFTYGRRCLAAHLASQGLECFVTNLRGAGTSDSPKGSWGIDEYVTQDVPAMLRCVRETSGREPVRWVGHSLGGILLYFHMMEHPKEAIEVGVTLGSTLDFKIGTSTLKGLASMLPVLKPLSALPVAGLMKLNGLVAGAGPNFMGERMNFHRPNVDPRVIRDILNSAFEPVPIQVFRGLATTFSDEGFSRDGGDMLYEKMTEHYRLPTLFIGGDRDRLCVPDALARTVERLANHPESALMMVGEGAGHDEGYGHFDLIIGDRAEEEVWPALTQFLLS